MAERELWLPVVQFQDHMSILRKLEAVGILTFDEIGRGWGSNKTFFEYARARICKNGRIFIQLCSKTNGMFVRPQLWNV